MSDSESNLEVWLLAGAASAVGPAVAVLHETGFLSLGPPATLWQIGFIVVASLAGLATGLGIAGGVSRTLGIAVALPNFLVLAVYGFLLLFFASGGSR